MLMFRTIGQRLTCVLRAIHTSRRGRDFGETAYLFCIYLAHIGMPYIRVQSQSMSEDAVRFESGEGLDHDASNIVVIKTIWRNCLGYQNAAEINVRSSLLSYSLNRFASLKTAA